MKKRLLTIAIIVSLTIGNALAGEVNLKVGDSAFVPKPLTAVQNFEVFRFNLPEIPQGSRIDFAGLVLNIQRDSIDLNDTLASDYLPLALLPVTSDWTKGSLENGQILAIDSTWASSGVADMNMGNRVEMDITQLVSDWLKGNKVNKGFMLVPEFAEDKTNFSVMSNAGIKVEVVAYYTPPEVVK
jgi:hypothetical protein